MEQQGNIFYWSIYEYLNAMWLNPSLGGNGAFIPLSDMIHVNKCIPFSFRFAAVCQRMSFDLFYPPAGRHPSFVSAAIYMSAVCINELAMGSHGSLPKRDLGPGEPSGWY